MEFGIHRGDVERIKCIVRCDTVLFVKESFDLNLCLDDRVSILQRRAQGGISRGGSGKGSRLLIDKAKDKYLDLLLALHAVTLVNT